MNGPSLTEEKCEESKQQAKTIYNILSKLKEADELNESNKRNQNSVSDTGEADDIVILRKDPETKNSFINRTAYLKLHRNLSPNRKSAVDKIKGNYENTSAEKTHQIDSKVPVPKPRRSRLIKSQIITPPSIKPKHEKVRHSLNLDRKKKDVNSNNLARKDESGSDEYLTIVRNTRSDSLDSVNQYQRELDAFTMDKKRSNSFKKIFSGKFFGGKDKKKKEEEKNRAQNKENGTYTENIQNESNSFSRQSQLRHTTGGDTKLNKSKDNNVQRSEIEAKIPKYSAEKIEKDYAQMHINQFNRYKENFENSNLSLDNRIPQGYVPMNKPILKSNDSNPYMNMPDVRKYIDTSSSASTLESDRSNLYQNDVLAKVNQNDDKNSGTLNKIHDNRRDTPPRALETRQDVRLVNPRALNPIYTDRPLPIPSRNSVEENQPRNRYSFQNSDKEFVPNKPILEETYGTVLDSIDRKHSNSTMTRIPRSPSLEPSKLKLPQNREIVQLSPRIRSPIPPENVTAEKIIATELLKPRRSPTSIKQGRRDTSPSHQRLEIDIDYPENLECPSEDNLVRSLDSLSLKPPIGYGRNSATKTIPKKSPDSSKSSNDISSMSQISPVSMDRTQVQPSPIGSVERMPVNSVPYLNSTINRTPTPSKSLQNISLSPMRPVSNGRPMTPLNSRIPESPKTTPQKEEMRKSVEAYYWKEIKKLKDQENYDMYLYQLQYANMMPPYVYAEEPINVRRSRSLSPSTQRSGRRSLSLPRDSRPPTTLVFAPSAIPEDRIVINNVQPRSVQQIQFQQNFVRNTPERRTVDGSSRGYDTNSIYRPIFKRGSLSTPPRQIVDDQLKRKVSFSSAASENVQWPTKNGYTKSPPQRRLDKLESPNDDDVFLPNPPNVVDGNRFRHPSNNSIRYDLPNEEMYYNTRQYVSRNQLPTSRHYSENPFGQRLSNVRYLPTHPEGNLCGQPMDAIRTPQGLTRHGSIQINEDVPRQVPRRISYQNNPPPRREIIFNDEIFGQFGGYVAPNNDIYSSRQSMANQNNYYKQRQVSVTNRVCDIYGQIHDTNGQRKVQQSGVLIGQLNKIPGSPAVVRNSYSQLPNSNEHFARNGRLTASANDMYRRAQVYRGDPVYGRIDSKGPQDAPTRPLPPLPQSKPKGPIRRNVSDTESASDASEVQRILNISAKNKKRSVFGK